MRIAIVLAGLLLAAGCRASLEGAPCPCLDGYLCNPQNVCVRFTEDPDIDAASQDDAGGGAPDASVDGGPDASIDAGGELPDAGEFPDAAGEKPDASGFEDAALVATPVS